MEALVMLMGGKRGAIAALASAALLLALAGQGAWLVARGWKIDALEAAAGSHADQLAAKDDRLNTLRGQVAELQKSAAANNLAFDLLRAEYDRLAREAGVRATQDAEAIAAAQAAAADAERTLAKFMDRYRASYTGGCKAAIEQLDRVCPNLANP